MFLRGFLYLGIFVITVFNLNAQDYEKPNYKKIRKQIKKKNSNYYYPNLFKKFERGDLTMSLKEKQFLYFGYAFQKNFQPYSASKEKGAINKLLKKKTISRDDLNTILRLSKIHLNKNPFDIQLHQVQIYAFKRLRLKKKIERKLNQIKIISDAVLSTGNGLSEKSAYHILYISHEKTILDSLTLVQNGKHISLKTIECINVKSNKKNVKKVYFNLTLCYKQSLN